MNNYLKIGAVVIALGAGTLLASCQRKGEDAPKPEVKIEQVSKNSATPRLDSLERRVKSLEISRRDVRKYLKQKAQEMKAKGF